MSPPEVWGPAVWSLFHTLAERVNAHIYPYIARQMFKMFVRICGFLPCPECSTDASNFLAKIKIENLKTKEEFKQTFYLFHNYVNAKKRKPLFNYSSLAVYQRYLLIPIVNNFIISYNTKGNMKMINESFQRQFVIKDFKNWFTANIKAFMPQIHPHTNVVSTPSAVVSIEEKPVVEEVVVEEVVVEEVVGVSIEEVIVEEEAIVSIEEAVVEEKPVEEVVVKEVVVVEELLEEPIVEENAVSTKSTNNKKKKKNKK